MDLRCYLAMTAAEFSSGRQQPHHPAWMACHFSCYSTGISNIPRALPPESMVILNDRTPPSGHDKQRIADQLNELVTEQQVSCILLDLQRPNDAQTQKIATYLCTHLSCPVAVSDIYAKECSCPVFLPMPPPHVSVSEHITPWADRPIWLELATETETAMISRQGCRFVFAPQTELPASAFTDDTLHCRYHAKVQNEQITFTLSRDKAQVLSVLREAQALGVTHFVGLYQQLGAHFPEDLSQEMTADG